MLDMPHGHSSLVHIYAKPDDIVATKHLTIAVLDDQPPAANEALHHLQE